MFKKLKKLLILNKTFINYVVAIYFIWLILSFFFISGFISLPFYLIEWHITTFFSWVMSWIFFYDNIIITGLRVYDLGVVVDFIDWFVDIDASRLLDYFEEIAKNISGTFSESDVKTYKKINLIKSNVSLNLKTL